jgi:hypothetical protein
LYTLAIDSHRQQRSTGCRNGSFHARTGFGLDHQR